MYEHILLPTDGSEGVSNAIEEAIDLAEMHDATLHLLYVVDTSAAAALPTADATNLEEILETAGDDAIETIRERAEARGVPVESYTDHGLVHETILKYAEEADIDLIVMGTQGRSGLDRLLLGSVTERVIKQATRPVLVIRTMSGQ